MGYMDRLAVSGLKVNPIRDKPAATHTTVGVYIAWAETVDRQQCNYRCVAELKRDTLGIESGYEVVPEPFWESVGPPRALQVIRVRNILKWLRFLHILGLCHGFALEYESSAL